MLEHYVGNFFGLSIKHSVDTMHFISAGMVSFARGLNDTPKIATILIITQVISANYAIIGVVIAIVLGGLISSQKVAHTLSHGITKMTPSQELKANMITSFIVIFASKFGVPVSTTNVSGSAMYWEDFRRLLEKISHINFFSITVRAFKINLEDRCENYAQTATYLGNLVKNKKQFTLDENHQFIANQPLAICGNTTDILHQSRYAPLFKVIGNKSSHYGLFNCNNITNKTTVSCCNC